MGGPDEGSRQSFGDRLIAAGWCQGALFVLDSAWVSANVPADPGSDQLTEVRKTRKLKVSEKLIVASQTCDIVASEQAEPLVLAYICGRESQKLVDNVEQNSARFFVVHPETRLVARARYPVLIAKEALLQVAPEPWPSSERRFQRFVRWLARRYDRPAIPDELVEAFQKPVELALRELSDREPRIRAAFSRAVHEIRVNSPGEESPPYYIQLVLLAREPTLTEEESSSIAVVLETIQAAIEPELVRLEPQPWIVTEHEISWGAYHRTRPLYLEYLTYRGEEAEGAEPFPRA